MLPKYAQGNDYTGLQLLITPFRGSDLRKRLYSG